MRKRVLIVEDDSSLARMLRDNLVAEGFVVQSVADGSEATRTFEDFTPDLVLLDVALPGLSGLDLCRMWKLKGTPIIMLTVKSDKNDKIRAFSMGVDDYVTKPFELQELLARVRAVLRRARPAVERIVLGGVSIDFVKQEARKGKHVIELSSQEFSILHYLAERPTMTVPRDELLRAVWGYDSKAYTRAVDHAIVRLRRKIEPHSSRLHFIRSVYGGGYRLTPDEP